MKDIQYQINLINLYWNKLELLLNEGYYQVFLNLGNQLVGVFWVVGGIIIGFRVDQF